MMNNVMGMGGGGGSGNGNSGNGMTRSGSQFDLNSDFSSGGGPLSQLSESVSKMDPLGAMEKSLKEQMGGSGPIGGPQMGPPLPSTSTTPTSSSPSSATSSNSPSMITASSNTSVPSTGAISSSTPQVSVHKILVLFMIWTSLVRLETAKYMVENKLLLIIVVLVFCKEGW